MDEHKTKRRLEGMTMRKLANVTLALIGWLDDEADSAEADEETREARRLLRALSRPLQPQEPTLIHDSLGRVIGMTDPPPPLNYSCRLGDDDEVLVTTSTDTFVFAWDKVEVLRFVDRRPLGQGEADGNRPL